jgi:hypothetical protein
MPERSDDRVRAQAARCLVGLLSPKFTQCSSNLKDREHLVDLLFITFDAGPAFVQSEVLHTLSESWIWATLIGRYIGGAIGSTVQGAIQ